MFRPLFDDDDVLTTANTHWENGDAEGAVRVLAKFPESHPRARDYYWRMGEYYQKLGNRQSLFEDKWTWYRRAIEAYGVAVRIDPMMIPRQLGSSYSLWPETIWALPTYIRLLESTQHLPTIQRVTHILHRMGPEAQSAKQALQNALVEGNGFATGLIESAITALSLSAENEVLAQMAKHPPATAWDRRFWAYQLYELGWAGLSEEAMETLRTLSRDSSRKVRVAAYCAIATA